MNRSDSPYVWGREEAGDADAVELDDAADPDGDVVIVDGRVTTFRDYRR